MSWAHDEFKTLELGDQRLNARAVLLAERLTSKPTESIPNACLGWAETQAAYRFLSNPRTDWQALLQPHWASSLERMRGHKVLHYPRRCGWGCTILPCLWRARALPAVSCELCVMWDAPDRH